MATTTIHGSRLAVLGQLEPTVHGKEQEKVKEDHVLTARSTRPQGSRGRSNQCRSMAMATMTEEEVADRSRCYSIARLEWRLVEDDGGAAGHSLRARG